MPTVNEILESARDWNLLSQRQARETFRSVYRVDGAYILKKFEIPWPVTRFRRPWEVEHQALTRLPEGLAPRSFGFSEIIRDGVRTVWLAKEFVPGHTLAVFAPEDIPLVASLMGQLHRQLVVTDDASIANFLKTSDGRMIFLDLGRARLFNRKHPLFYVQVGAELAKFRREGLAWNHALWHSFIRHYFRGFCCSYPVRLFIKTSCAISTGIRMVRKVVQCKSPRS